MKDQWATFPSFISFWAFFRLIAIEFHIYERNEKTIIHCGTNTKKITNEQILKSRDKPFVLVVVFVFVVDGNIVSFMMDSVLVVMFLVVVDGKIVCFMTDSVLVMVFFVLVDGRIACFIMDSV